MLLAALGALALLAAACGGDPEQPAGEALPADGTCRAGVVLQAGEECTHEYSYRTGTRITASGSRPIMETAAIVFRVDAEGIGHYGDELSGTRIERTIELEGETIRFAASARDDGSFYIEEATRADVEAEAGGDAAACVEGMTLEEGERCLIPGGGGEFSVEADGSGCFEGSICSGRSLQIGGFSAERSGDGWTITSLP